MATVILCVIDNQTLVGIFIRLIPVTDCGGGIISKSVKYDSKFIIPPFKSRLFALYIKTYLATSIHKSTLS